MKRIFVILLSFLVASYAEGKDKDGNPYYEKGYVGNVGLNVGGTIGRYDEIGIMTVHGFSFADGFMLGGGTGILIPLEFDSKEREVFLFLYLQMQNILCATVGFLLSSRVNSAWCTPRNLEQVSLCLHP